MGYKFPLTNGGIVKFKYVSNIFDKFHKGHATGYLIVIFPEDYEKLGNILFLFPK